MQPTPEQTAIIEAPRGDLLVSAAAGSGKTAVLTDRIVRRIIDGELDIRGVLVMTFTDAAARNMKDKIEQKLRAALAATRDTALRRRLGQQLALLPGAAISTIHAFCLDVIHNFYNCARDEKGKPLIEPGFAVDDGVEADLLLRRTLDELMADCYEAIDKAADGEPSSGFDTTERQTAFYRLIEGYGGDQSVRSLLLRRYHYLRSLPDYTDQVTAWLADLRQAAADFSSSRHCAGLLGQLRILLARALAVADDLEDLLAQGVRFIAKADRNQAYCDGFQSAVNILRGLDNSLRTGRPDWDEIRTAAAGLTGLDLPRAGRGDSPEKQTFLDLFCSQAAEVVYCLSGSCGSPKCNRHFIFNTRPVFGFSAAEIEADIAEMLPAVEMLFSLVMELDRHYAQNKRAAGLIDFSDFEHLALAILREEEARRYYRGRFAEIYVDEYQDTSSIQEEIIQAVSDGNCLAVGDIKQSIYRFRHARPRIFIDRAERFRAGSGGRLFELNRNFRSVAGILAAANDLFGQLMSRGAGEIDYDERQMLVEHRPNHADLPVPVTVLLVDRLDPGGSEDSGETPSEAGPSESLSAEPAAETGDAADGADDSEAAIAAELNRYEQESLAVAARMQTLHAAGSAWHDMVVLTRTRSIGLACRTQLERCGIPVQADTGGAFLDTPATRQLDALVHLLDNIRQDIPLAAVLRSEIIAGGFSDEELVRIRLWARDNQLGRFFHEAVLGYAADGPDPELRRRLAEALAWLDSLRRREQIVSLGEMLGLVFDESGWLERLAAKQDGVAEIRRLRQFRQWAEQFEARRPRGLHAFASHIDSLRERGGTDSPFAAADSGQDAVLIITIHGSKGLEFPVVFLVGTSCDLSPKDNDDALLVSESLGLGMDYADPERQIRYPTHLKLAMLEEARAAGLAEEMRLFYVAMTRAMDRLYLVGSVKVSSTRSEARLAALVRQARSWPSRQLPDHLALAGRSYLDWLLMALARQPGINLDWLEDGSFPEGEQTSPVWRLEYLTLAGLNLQMNARTLTDTAALPGQAAAVTPNVVWPALLGSIDPALLRRAHQRIVAPYRFEQAARVPAKLTVSELKRREPDDREEADGWPRGIGLELHEWSGDPAEKEPAGGELAAGELGTLLHAFFRLIDLKAASRQPDEAEIRRQLAELGRMGLFNPEELTALASFTREFAWFAASSLAAAMARAAERAGAPIHSEIPFALALPACRVHEACTGLGSDDQVLVQGIIDCWFEDDDGTITLVDYKSDHLPAEPLLAQQELEKRYALQLDYYARAIRAATGKSVARRLIWLIRQGRSVTMPEAAHE